MKLAAVHAIADLAKQPVPDVVNEAYHVNNFTFGPDYFIPKPVDPRLITEVSMAVAKAAMESGVARKNITDWEAYKTRLRELMGQESKLTRQLYETARRDPQRWYLPRYPSYHVKSCRRSQSRRYLSSYPIR